jgi:hypothetical protein
LAAAGSKFIDENGNFAGVRLRKAELILRLFDPKRDREVRVYKCECGEVIWHDLRNRER